LRQNAAVAELEDIEDCYVDFGRAESTVQGIGEGHSGAVAAVEAFRGFSHFSTMAAIRWHSVERCAVQGVEKIQGQEHVWCKHSTVVLKQR
jgi:hypothetical protein